MNEVNELSMLQTWIAGQVRSTRALTSSAEVCETAARHLTGNDRLSPVDQLEIYRRQFWLRHTSSLVEDFPGVSGILGQQAWEQLVESYLTLVPPTSWTLRDLGKEMEAHIRGRTNMPHQALCADMAALEWAYIEIFDAADHGTLDPSKLAGLSDEDWQGARVITSAALRLLRVDYPVASLRKSLRLANETSHGESVAIPEPAPQHLVLFRSENRGLFHRTIDATAWRLLKLLQAGLTLTSACQQVADAEPTATQTIENNIGKWFQQWGELGWIHDVVTEAEHGSLQ